MLSLRKKYYEEDEAYRMMALDASKPEQLETLPDGESAVVLLEGVSMYLTNEQVPACSRRSERNTPAFRF